MSPSLATAPASSASKSHGELDATGAGRTPAPSPTWDIGNQCPRRHRSGPGLLPILERLPNAGPDSRHRECGCPSWNSGPHLLSDGASWGTFRQHGSHRNTSDLPPALSGRRMPRHWRSSLPGDALSPPRPGTARGQGSSPAPGWRSGYTPSAEAAATGPVLMALANGIEALSGNDHAQRGEMEAGYRRFRVETWTETHLKDSWQPRTMTLSLSGQPGTEDQRFLGLD